MILSRSRRTRDPSTLLNWSIVSQQGSDFPSKEATISSAHHFQSRSGYYSLNFHQPSGGTTNINSNTIVVEKFSQRSEVLPELGQQHHGNHSSSAKNRSYVKNNKCTSSCLIQVATVEAGVVVKQEKIPRKAKKKQQQQQQQNLAEHKSQDHPRNDLRRSRSLPITAHGKNRRASGFPRDEALEDEKWAGPAYSKSPPPSSLPFPKFSAAQPSRSLSMELELAGQELDITSSATKDLKRILNLDVL